MRQQLPELPFFLTSESLSFKTPTVYTFLTGLTEVLYSDKHRVYLQVVFLENFQATRHTGEDTDSLTEKGR